jgi:hypothetical protein
MIRLPAGTAANKELARDLGQFTIDGGVLIIGADAGDETTPPSLTPVDLARLTERIEEVAANRVDPPLHVRIQTIAAAGQPGKGYVLSPTLPTGSEAGISASRSPVCADSPPSKSGAPGAGASGPGPASGRRRGQVGRPEGPGGPG